jgi:hypothetical protein
VNLILAALPQHERHTNFDVRQARRTKRSPQNSRFLAAFLRYVVKDVLGVAACNIVISIGIGVSLAPSPTEDSLALSSEELIPPLTLSNLALPCRLRTTARCSIRGKCRSFTNCPLPQDRETTRNGELVAA